ncbi:glycerate kinase [Actinoalloteichus sp. AHMU CJ021]|uniref:Glycerate kinase n=1 Tax=Actinoalloteichus caeruleus DSM 43889 TaxID=1120930 RepID=A0ABT1JJJ2_ACTCY|nr:glycerate kinase [Actinoalloteichus caeruleus]AUS77935.1 glycerate kinase [Actinoalloteichus sp. AHMU CJ021]MCP2331901.1 glycerate kinase [Actinoalloteichus caeruleus DSM 43889]
MRILVAPDCFGGTLTAPEAAEAIAEGWRRGSPGDELVARPVADGGPGFVDVLRAALGGTVHRRRVSGPLGDPVEAEWLEVRSERATTGRRSGTAYLESAQACGLHLVPRRTPENAGRAGTRGVGELLAAARDAGVATAVVGLGGSGSTDGGAGMLSALGAVPVGDDGAPLEPGGLALTGCAGIRGTADLDGMRVVLASDVEHTLVGEHGAAAVFGPQKGADAGTVTALDTALTRWADALTAATGLDVRDVPGSGAAGGLGAGLLALGGTTESGAGLVRTLTGLDEALDTADLVLTGEGSFDWQSLRGKLVTVVARAAADRGVPCLVLAGQVAVGRREAAAVGVERAFSVAEHAGSVDAALAEPAPTLTALAADVARQWGGR